MFERENQGRVWNVPADALSKQGFQYADLMERQYYLARVRDQMRQEGQEVDASDPSNDPL